MYRKRRLQSSQNRKGGPLLLIGRSQTLRISETHKALSLAASSTVPVSTTEIALVSESVGRIGSCERKP